LSKPDYIELPTGECLTILYQDRSVLALDKPVGWMLVPFSWQTTNRNLQAALVSSIAAGDFWARSAHLKFIRYVHRLDADTTGVLLFAKSPGAVNTFGKLFESRKMEKVYLAVIAGVPRQRDWICRLKLGRDAKDRRKSRVDPRHGKEAETHFRVLQVGNGTTLVEARPLTGRTHQIRVHLAESAFPVVGDELYGRPDSSGLALRAVRLAYVDPFTRRQVEIRAPSAEFCRRYRFENPE
jgi:23S rRNA pseudouridine1911/1915/1917 synthase